MNNVITYMSPNEQYIKLTPEQCDKLEAAGKWPKDRRGSEYCQVSRGLHAGNPTYTDAELAAEVRLESL